MNILHFTSSARAFTGFGTCQEETSQANPEQIPRNCYSNLLFPFADFFLNVRFSRTAYEKEFTVCGISWRNVPQEILQGRSQKRVRGQKNKSLITFILDLTMRSLWTITYTLEISPSQGMWPGSSQLGFSAKVGDWCSCQLKMTWPWPQWCLYRATLVRTTGSSASENIVDLKHSSVIS